RSPVLSDLPSHLADYLLRVQPTIGDYDADDVVRPKMLPSHGHAGRVDTPVTHRIEHFPKLKTYRLVRTTMASLVQYSTYAAHGFSSSLGLDARAGLKISVWGLSI